ncbi:DNA-directed RNA polymerase subunit alpha C-terminal domain-containing protein [Jeotgalibacillus haloalkalitolerans]|uniref:DNA-directed RNA polymerase subunit alpha C-terminal domain-containing protein n=1 Tax=Jeotgalibacillus haloalkalitolerans TaxID=3104292 RepID=A0ABU5KHU1_9BACL|nr:DNA-directed RNA polymerase subunit alpha C-terminal domain-containing protein [Jeotgalibacillus sp. HH7-29]MDZ5710814.1 DNA-directed RNA polymerase subunit alpha C-terminal domain-containing protein [Jeotgalibacillus sp. HH7-29]
MTGDLPSGLSKPSQRAFAQAGIKTMTDIQKYTEKELLSLHGVGPKTIRQLKEAGGTDIFKNS